MIEPKSGTSIDTTTARQTREIRSQAINTRLSERLNLQANVAHGFRSTSELGVWQSRPSKDSNAMFSGRVARENFVLSPKVRSDQVG
jgi:hypothetical protein